MAQVKFRSNVAVFSETKNRTSKLTPDLPIISLDGALNSVHLKLLRKKMFNVQTLHRKSLKMVLSLCLLGMTSILKLIMRLDIR